MAKIDVSTRSHIESSEVRVTASRALPVTISHLSKHFGSTVALDDVSLSVDRGEFVTLLGPSGSGKTTLLMIIAGFARPTAGSIRIGEREIVRLPPHRRDVGMVFQNYALFPHMTVAGNIGYPLRLRRLPKLEIAKRVERVLELVQLSGFGDRRVDQLSGGQRQRVALARAIVFEPRILLMDEPLSALDRQLRERMQMEIRQLHDRLGMTTIAVTHDQREALTMSDRVAVLHQGRLMQLDTPRELYDRPANRFVAEFIGESSFLPVSVENGVVHCCDQTLALKQAPCAHSRQVLLLRPEKLSLLDGRPATGNELSGNIAGVVFQGESVLLTIILKGGHAIHARVPNRGLTNGPVPRVGSFVRLELAAEDVVLLPEQR
jgi:putative spermidine/putrescine transport system ATP-binding protein